MKTSVARAFRPPARSSAMSFVRRGLVVARRRRLRLVVRQHFLLVPRTETPPLPRAHPRGSARTAGGFARGSPPPRPRAARRLEDAMTRDGKVKEGPGGRASDRTATGRTRKVDEIDVDVDATARDGVDLLDLLPRALIDYVVSRLDGVAVARLGMTCRRMRAATRSHATWRRLAEAQESAPSLTRLDLVTRDFTFRHLYAWRRHVLRYATAARGGVNRIAVADSSRILTCDPVLGGGRAYVAHESDAGHPSARVLPVRSPHTGPHTTPLAW